MYRRPPELYCLYPLDGRCPGFVLRPTFDILPEDANDWQLYFSDGGINVGDNYTTNRIFYSTVFSPGFYWYEIAKLGMV